MSRPISLHPRHGIHDPSSATPQRVPGSIRRTTSLDAWRPDGFSEPIHLEGAGRDLVTLADGRAVTVHARRVHAVVDSGPARTLLEVSATPTDERLAALVGERVRAGFRARLCDTIPDQRAAGSLVHQLLDDLPVVAMVSNHAVYAADEIPPSRPSGRADICSGWRTGGTLLTHYETTGQPPIVTGPPSRPQTRDDDPDAWHDMSALPPHGMRRMRRLDVAQVGGQLRFDGFYRDSHLAPDGPERSVHEYTFHGSVDLETLQITGAEVRAHALPWLECSPVTASAAALVGRPLRALRTYVREELHGTSACTHLNDAFRTLEDIAVLAEMARASG